MSLLKDSTFTLLKCKPNYGKGWNLTMVDSLTCTVTHSLISDNVLMLQGFQDFNFPFKIPHVFLSAMLEFLNSYNFTSVVLKRVISTKFHTSKVTLQ